MCSIAGFWDRSRSTGPDAMRCSVERMTRALAHRGPDGEGIWMDSVEGIALGHRRLAIVDLTADGAQPMDSHLGRFTIAFNGEIYNYRTLREELARLGHRFRGASDTEVMLAAIERWGVEKAIEHFNGMFAFAVWDSLERQLWLVRDRAGEKPLYYGMLGRTLVFASELKALRTYPDFAAEIDREALSAYTRRSFIQTPETIYKGVYKLPAGCMLTFEAGNSYTLPAPKPYWRLREVVERAMTDRFKGSPIEAADELERLLSDAVGLRMVADVPLGAFLSGGVDSSTIVALMQTRSRKPVRTFTIGFDEASYNEAKQACMVAEHLGADHTELYVTPPEAMEVIPRLASIYDEPFADSSQIPTILVSELARRHVTVSLSGDGGDELFGGYMRYLWTEDIWRKTSWASHPARKAAARALTGLPVARWDRIFRTLNPWLPCAVRQRNPGEKLHKLAEVLNARSQEAMYAALTYHWKSAQSIVLGAPEFSGQPAGIPAGDFVERMMFADTMSYLPDDILVKVDRASMSVALEGRVPLLDHRLIEFAWRIPQAMKIRNGEGKWLLRQVLYRHIPRKLIERPKMGFAVPLDEWLRGPLRPWAEELLEERRVRSEGFFDPAPIRQKWTEHVTGTRNWQYHIWNVLMFQAWLEESRRSEPVSLEPAPLAGRMRT